MTHVTGIANVVLVGEMARGGYTDYFARTLSAWRIPLRTVVVPSLFYTPLLMRSPFLHVNRALARARSIVASSSTHRVVGRMLRTLNGRCVTLVVGVHAIESHTIGELRAKGPIVLFFNDDLETRRGRSVRWWAHAQRLLDSVDLLVTQRPHREHAIRRHYLGQILFQDFAYMEMFHRPYVGPTPARWACDVGFIGNFDSDRLQVVHDLAHAGLQLGIWGVHWPREAGTRLNGFVAPPAVPRALAASKVGLGLVRHNNFDYQVMRTFEIPACGAFLLAERTPDHQRLFQEGEEAEFFADSDELVSKARFYSRNAAARQQIASAGYRRIMAGANTLADRLRQVLRHPALGSAGSSS